MSAGSAHRPFLRVGGMSHLEVARIASVERTAAPRLFVLIGLLCSFTIGGLIAANLPIAFGFIAFLTLLCFALFRPSVLAAGLVVLSVFIERSLQPVRITVGGTELLNFNGVVNLCLVVIVLFYAVINRLRPFQSLLTRSFFFYLVIVAFSVLFSTDAVMTIHSIVRISSAYCIYLLITQFVTEKAQIDRVFLTLIVVSAIPIVVGLYQIAFRNHFVVSRDLRIYGTLRNGMSYAMYLALVLPYVLGQALSAKGGLARKCFFWCLFLAGLVNLVYSSTRIGWGVFACALIVYGVLANATRLLPSILALLVLCVIVFFPFFARSFGGYFRTDLQTYLSDDVSWDSRSQDYITASSLHIRVFVWRHMLRRLLDTNVWFGAGSGTWFENTDRQMVGFPIASHSDYLEVLFGTGLIGLSIYLMFRIRQLLLLAHFARGGVEHEIKMTVLFPCLATHVACLGMSITEVWQAYSGIYWLSWITCGISESYYVWYRSQEHSAETAEATANDA
jgi:O-antigen ligase